MTGRATTTSAANSHCQTCGVLTHIFRGLAEYHPYEFCRVYKAGGDPWKGYDRRNINEVGPALKAELQENCRRFWRERHHTEVTLP